MSLNGERQRVNFPNDFILELEGRTDHVNGGCDFNKDIATIRVPVWIQWVWYCESWLDDFEGIRVECWGHGHKAVGELAVAILTVILASS